MSILDTFYILFKTDADKAAEDIKDVDRASDAAAAGLNQMDNAASKVGASFINMGKALVAPLAGLISFGALANVAMERATAVLEIDKAASKLNSSVSQVDAFSRSVKAAGGTTEQAVDSLAKLSEKLNEAFSDKDSASRKDFTEWGLAFKTTKGDALGAVDALKELAGNLEGVSRAEALARIKKLGIEDATTIDLLLKGRRAIEERMKAEEAQGVVTEAQVQISRDYQRELGQTGNMLTSFGNRILENVLPAITKMIGAFRTVISWMNENGTLVQGFFIGLATVITVAYLPAVTAAAVAGWAAIAPIIAIAAPIAAAIAAVVALGAAFALAYEDVVAFMDGQPSLIGELAKKYEWVATAVKVIGDAWNATSAQVSAALTALGPVFDTLKTVGLAALDGLISGAKSLVTAYVDIYGPVWRAVSELFQALGRLADAFATRFVAVIAGLVSPVGDAARDIVTAFEPVTEGFRILADKIPEVFRVMVGIVKDIFQDLFGWIASGISGITSRINSVTSWISGGGGSTPANDNAAAGGAAIGRMLGRGRAQIGAAEAFPAASVAAGGAGSTTTNSVTVGSVVVNTQATDAKGVAAAVRGELTQQFRDTSARLDDGVAR